jgi:Tfp pilus assembly protein PilN
MREQDERLLAWIPTAPELSNNLVMTATMLKWREQRASQQRRRPWLLLGVALVGAIGYALGRSRR